MTLTAATYLGDNTIGSLQHVVVDLCRAGIDTRLVKLDAPTSAHALANARNIDMVWMCGGLFAVMHQDDALSHVAVAAPIFRGETKPVYRSVLIGHHDAAASFDRTATGTIEGCLAINELASWSGHRALRRHLAPRWFEEELITGSHRRSIDAVACGDADWAAIDHSIWHAFARDSSELTVIDHTQDWPAPPVVIAPHVSSDIARRVAEQLLAFPGDDSVGRFVATTSTAYGEMA